MRTFKTMLKTEIKLSLRGMDMVIFSICMPIVAAAVIGMIYGAKPAFAGAQYTFLEQSFGAVSSIAICAGGLMGLPLVVSDYRSKKILKRFRVTPVGPAVILAVQLVIYMLYAVVSVIILYAVSALFFPFKMYGSWLVFLGAYFLVMLSMFSIGMMVGGIAPNTKIAGVIASILYFPMLIFSGATLPYEVMPAPLQKVVDLLPLTQGIKLLKAAFLGLSPGSVLLPVLLMIAVAVVCIGIALRFFQWE